MKFAENEENFTYGFWPGDKNYPHASLYSYFYPAPAAIETLKYYSPYMREFILDYKEVVANPDPEGTILKFLEETYDQGAILAGWNTESLKGEIPIGSKVYY
jgi:hypothetical protein